MLENDYHYAYSYEEQDFGDQQDAHFERMERWDLEDDFEDEDEDDTEYGNDFGNEDAGNFFEQDY